MSTTTTADPTDAELDQLRSDAADVLEADTSLLNTAHDVGSKKRHEEIETLDTGINSHERAAHEINQTVRRVVEMELMEAVQNKAKIPSELDGHQYDVVRAEVNDLADRIMDDLSVCPTEIGEELAEREAREPDRDPDVEYERWRDQQYGK